MTHAWQRKFAIVVGALPWSGTAIAQNAAGELPDILAEAVAAREGVTDTVAAQGIEGPEWLDRFGEPGQAGSVDRLAELECLAGLVRIGGVAVALADALPRGRHTGPRRGAAAPVCSHCGPPVP